MDFRSNASTVHFDHPQERVYCFVESPLPVIRNPERQFQLRALRENTPAPFQQLNRRFEALMNQQHLGEIEIICLFIAIHLDGLAQFRHGLQSVIRCLVRLSHQIAQFCRVRSGDG
jgi:hypothetical protein